MRLRLRVAAVEDVAVARAWYESERPGLGDDFLVEVDAALERIVESPLRYPVLVRDTRQALLRRFPYRLLYRVAGEDVVVVACFHARRDPGLWKRR